MSRWNELFQNHAFRSSLGGLKSALEDKDLEKNNNEDAVKEIGRLRKVIGFIDSIIEQIDPELIAIAQLDSINQSISTSLSEVNQFKGNQNIGHLHNANTNIDSVLVRLCQTPFSALGTQKGALGRAANAYASNLDGHLRKLSESVNSETSRVKNVAVEIQNGLSESQKALNELKGQLQSVAQTIQQQTAEFNTQFQGSEKSRAEKFDSIAVRLQEKADEEFKQLSIKTGKILEVLMRLQADSEKVFGVVVNTLQAGAYSSYANEEKNTANLLRWAAIALMMTGVAILVAPEIAKLLKDAAEYKLDWMMTLGRVPFSIILFVPAFYLARESNKHRNNEILNRRRELILSTIDPYLALMDEKKAEEIKTEIAKGIFSEGQVPNEQTVSDSSNVLAQLANLVKQIK